MSGHWDAKAAARLKAWALFLPAVLILGFCALLFLSEAFMVGVQQHTAGYPFGLEGPHSDLPYHSPTAYTFSSLLWGLFALTLGSIGTVAFFRGKRKIYVPLRWSRWDGSLSF